MIKFFRKIRQNLLSEGKTGKYFKYAIGEIVLVVIGILIALQINNWNEERKRLKQEQVLLSQLKDEIVSQYSDISYDLDILQTSQTAHYVIIDHLESNRTYQDSLCFYFSLLKLDEYIYPSEAAYVKIKDIGLDIISADDIRRDIQLLYEEHYPRISKGNSFNPDISEYLDDYYLENFELNTNYDLKFSLVIQAESIADKNYDEMTVSYPGKFDLNGNTRPYT
ncbi:MAG: hypothetical protein KJO52_03060, partial [Maribacter sp.]|nr:hypothetical protein [Maribacter sp.]